MDQKLPTVLQLFDLTGRVALVTGGCMGIGRQIAQGLLEVGAEVVVTSRDAHKADEASVDLASITGGKTLGLMLDVTDPDSVTGVFEEIQRRYGRLDILVNNAGGAPASEHYSLHDRDLDAWKQVMDTNLTGAFLCTQAAAKMMMSAGRGSIINLASVSGIVGRDRSMYEGLDMRPNIVDYSTCKAGLIGFTRDSAAELGPHGIRVNAISPGGVQRNHDPEFVRRYSEATALGRMSIEGLDMKGPAVLLASDAGSYITGANIVVDGGFVVFK